MGGWTGEKVGNYDMGKDIDRNITRQLWEKETGVTGDVFTKNDVIPVENGGTGVNNLELFYPKLVEDSYINRIEVNNLTTPVEGFTFSGDTNFFIVINKKSMYFEGTVHVTRNTNIMKDTYLNLKIPDMGYNIKEIQFAPYGTKISIVDNILSLKGYFDPSSNSYRYRFQNFVPII